jgi:hypothetical protein
VVINNHGVVIKWSCTFWCCTQVFPRTTLSLHLLHFMHLTLVFYSACCLASCHVRFGVVLKSLRVRTRLYIYYTSCIWQSFLNPHAASLLVMYVSVLYSSLSAYDLVFTFITLHAFETHFWTRMLPRFLSCTFRCCTQVFPRTTLSLHLLHFMHLKLVFESACCLASFHVRYGVVLKSFRVRPRLYIYYTSCIWNSFLNPHAASLLVMYVSVLY